MEHTQVAAWILAAMHHLAPQRDTRELAVALATQLVEKHGAMSAPAMLHLAAVEVAVMYRESTLDPRAIGDHGTSFCAGQINLPGKNTTTEGWTGPDLLESVDRCVHVVDRMLTASIHACKDLPPEDRLASYARGSCSSASGQELSRNRVRLARKLLAEVPVPAIKVEPQPPAEVVAER